MGQHSERLATIISAELIEWRLRENGGVEGVIYNSIHADYVDGDKYLFKTNTLTHWPAAEGFWPDHFIMKLPTGIYFMLKDKDRLNEFNSSSS